MLEQLALLQKKQDIIKESMINDECNLREMLARVERQKKEAILCFVFAAILLGLGIAFPKIREVSRENPMFQWVLVSISLMEVTRIFLFIACGLLALLGLRFLYHSVHALDQSTGLYGNILSVEKIIKERIERQREEVKELEKVIGERKKEDIKKQEKRVQMTSAEEEKRVVAKPDLTGVTKTLEGDLFLNLEDVWKDLEEETDGDA